DRFPQATLQLAAIQDDLLRMDRLDRVERYNEITRVLDVDYQLRPPMRRHLTDSPEFLAAIRDKGLISHFDVLSHMAILQNYLPQRLLFLRSFSSDSFVNPFSLPLKPVTLQLPKQRQGANAQ